jgi:hypothetical protein
MDGFFYFVYLYFPLLALPTWTIFLPTMIEKEDDGVDCRRRGKGRCGAVVGGDLTLWTWSQAAYVPRSDHHDRAQLQHGGLPSDAPVAEDQQRNGAMVLLSVCPTVRTSFLWQRGAPTALGTVLLEGSRWWRSRRQITGTLSTGDSVLRCHKSCQLYGKSVLESTIQVKNVCWPSAKRYVPL